MKFSIVVPVYNSESTLAELYLRIKSVLTSGGYNDFEVLLVNDFSSDNSWNSMKQIHFQDNRVKVINLAKNYGQHAASLCGISNATGDFVILIDDDLQHPPEEIPKLIDKITSDDSLDVVIGAYIDKRHSMFRNLGSKLMKIVSKSMFKSKENFRFTSFRIIRRSTAMEISQLRVHNPRLGGLIRSVTGNVASVLVEHNDRASGQSGYSFISLIKAFWSNVLNYSTIPLQFISSIGFSVSAISLVYIAHLVIRYLLHGSSVKGWTSLMVTVVFFSGLILTTLGIIGDYLLRILIETRKLPPYIEREKLL